MLLNYGAGEDSWESLGLQGDHWKDACWRWSSNTWAPDAKSWLIWQIPDVGKVWGQEEKGMTEDEMVGWHRQLKGHEYVWTLGWWWTRRPSVLPFMGSQELNMTEQLNWTEVDEYSVRFLSPFSFGFLWFCFWWAGFSFSLEDIPLWM